MLDCVPHQVLQRELGWTRAKPLLLTGLPLQPWPLQGQIWTSLAVSRRLESEANPCPRWYKSQRPLCPCFFRIIVNEDGDHIPVPFRFKDGFAWFDKQSREHILEAQSNYLDMFLTTFPPFLLLCILLPMINGAMPTSHFVLNDSKRRTTYTPINVHNTFWKPEVRYWTYLIADSALIPWMRFLFDERSCVKCILAVVCHGPSGFTTTFANVPRWTRICVTSNLHLFNASINTARSPSTGSVNGQFHPEKQHGNSCGN